MPDTDHAPPPSHDAMVEALEVQKQACAALGSALYARLLEGFVEDFEKRGIVHGLLAGRPERPVHDAIPLRLLGGLHRLALEGSAPLLARHYPTAGGTPGDEVVADALRTLEANADAVTTALGEPVQTNEVGRSVVLMALTHWLAALGEPEFDLVEVGCSAGLNLFFDRYTVRSPAGRMGAPDSSVVLADDAIVSAPHLVAEPARVVRRRGADPSPVDLGDVIQRLRLLSFVWPDQTQRFERLRAAMEIAVANPPRIERCSADVAIARLRHDGLERCTLIFHSIVWQYMGPQVQRSFVDELRQLARDNPGHTLVWARMEPAGPTADVRATVWRAGHASDHVLATVGYHGAGLDWTATTAIQE